MIIKYYHSLLLLQSFPQEQVCSPPSWLPLKQFTILTEDFAAGFFNLENLDREGRYADRESVGELGNS